MIKIQNSYVVFMLLGCLGAALSGCSGPPSVSDGRQVIEDRIKRDSEGRIRLVQFLKTNGQLVELMGVKVYTLEYETEIEFLEACKWNIPIFAGRIMDSEATFRTTKLPNKPMGALQEFTELATNPGSEVLRGQRIKLTGSIRFEKKEKGWWADSVQVASVAPADRSTVSPDQAGQQSPQQPANTRPPPSERGGLVNDYTDTHPMPLPTVQMSQADIDRLKVRWKAFEEAVRAQHPTPPLVLSADEINALIASGPDQRSLKGKFYVSIEGDRVEGDLSLPLQELGWKMVKNRYLNGSGTINVSLRNGVLFLAPQTIVVKGTPLPEMYMQGFRNQNFAASLTNQPDASAVLQGIQDVQVKDGKLIVVPREKL
jgi:hypothetical protein